MDRVTPMARPAAGGHGGSPAFRSAPAEREPNPWVGDRHADARALGFVSQSEKEADSLKIDGRGLREVDRGSPAPARRACSLSIGRPEPLEIALARELALDLDDARSQPRPRGLSSSHPGLFDAGTWHPFSPATRATSVLWVGFPSEVRPKRRVRTRGKCPHCQGVTARLHRLNGISVQGVPEASETAVCDHVSTITQPGVRMPELTVSGEHTGSTHVRRRGFGDAPLGRVARPAAPARRRCRARRGGDHQLPSRSRRRIRPPIIPALLYLLPVAFATVVGGRVAGWRRARLLGGRTRVPLPSAGPELARRQPHHPRHGRVSGWLVHRRLRRRRRDRRRVGRPRAGRAASGSRGRVTARPPVRGELGAQPVLRLRKDAHRGGADRGMRLSRGHVSSALRGRRRPSRATGDGPSEAIRGCSGSAGLRAHRSTSEVSWTRSGRARVAARSCPATDGSCEPIAAVRVEPGVLTALGATRGSSRRWSPGTRSSGAFAVATDRPHDVARGRRGGRRGSRRRTAMAVSGALLFARGGTSARGSGGGGRPHGPASRR